NYIMSNVAFASLVLFEVSLALGASVVLYFAWWDNIQRTSLLPAAHSLGCVDEGAVPHFTLEDALSVRIASILLMYGGLTMLHYVVIIFCSIKIWKKVRAASGMSRKTAAINSQLNNVLCLQAFTPLFVAVIPIFAAIVMLLFSIQWLGSLLELMTSVLSWIPIMNPVFTVIFVKAYRRSVLGLRFSVRIQQASNTTYGSASGQLRLSTIGTANN
ncbi:7TM GPCR protein, partial [Aphelenchoides avenae]